MTLVFPNGSGRIFAVFDSGIQLFATMPVNVIYFRGVCKTAAKMRHLLTYLCDTNYFVGFHFGLILTAFSLVLPGNQVVDINTKEMYRNRCIAMASRLHRLNQLINKQVINICDRHIFAVVFCDGIDY